MLNRKLKRQLKAKDDELDEQLTAILNMKHFAVYGMLHAVDAIAELPDDSKPAQELTEVIYFCVMIVGFAIGSDDVEDTLEHIYKIARVSFDDERTFENKTDSAEYRLRQYFLKIV